MASKNIIELAKHKRRNPTDEERTMWKLLQNRLIDFKIRRQHPLKSFIVDFYCAEAKLAIELDGDHHFKDDYDDVRDTELLLEGVLVIHFENEEVRLDAPGIADQIRDVCIERVKQLAQMKADQRINCGETPSIDP